jgi:aminoglycoside phosphotransferase family enzyme/predicted kinase
MTVSSAAIHRRLTPPPDKCTIESKSETSAKRTLIFMADRPDSQEEVLAFLADPAAHGGQKVRRIDTHASSVFLTDERALKVKRAVRFPFLDYSTLEKRKAACDAELEVNAPYAPQIYRGVVAITRDGEKFAVAGRGAPVEWAVEMARFDENRTLDHVAKEIDSALADALGRVVAEAHRRAQPLNGDAWIEALGSYIDEHVDAFRQHPRIFPRDDVNALARKSRAAYEQIAPLLRERNRCGFVRRIHGDLHLGNIVLLEGKPVLFDAIEFSDIIASGDTLYDLAFLLMDLLERGLEEQANTVFNRYLAESRHSEDLDALTAFPFFLSMRAAIRAKVTATRLERAAARERREIARTASKYFAFALRAIAPPPACLVAVGGLSGTGKSQLAQSLATDLKPMPGAVVVRSDLERKAMFATAETEKLPASAYTAEVTARIYATLADKARRILAAGHSAIVDAVFAQERERTTVAATGASAKVLFEGLFLTADLDIRLKRVGARKADASDADAAVAKSQETYDIGPIDWTPIDASGTPENTRKLARAALRRP